MVIQEPALWRDVPVRGEVLDASTRGLSGLESLRQLRGQPPMGRLTGVTFEGADEGTATFTMPVSAWLQWSSAGVPGGVLALPADAALGCALQSLMPAYTQYTTAEMSMTYVRPARVGSTVTARGRSLYAGRTMGLSECQVTDDAGRMVAHATSRMRIFGDPAAGAPTRGGTAVPPKLTLPAPSPDDGPDPYLRPVVHDRVDAEELRHRPGIEVVRAQIRGDLPLPPLHHLMGLVPTAAAPGAAACVLPLSGWLVTPFGWPQGGFIVVLADLALALAVQTTLASGERMASVDIKVNFLRPVAGDGSTIEARAKVVHRGRSLAVTTAEVIAADGRTVAIATGSAHLLGR
ncbi:MAG: PaaI family thioesterase [Candidatus Dormiibacterota bacterium]